MVGLIEDYAVIGNCETMALVGRDGSIDWLCLPRFDSAACFAALLGDDANGRWRIAPADNTTGISRRYRHHSMILETTFETDTGAVLLIDCMSRSGGTCELVRRIKGLRGKVSMQAELVVRFDYGISIPWVSRAPDGRIQFVVGPDRLMLQTEVEIINEDLKTTAAFEIAAGQTIDFALGWSQSFCPVPPPIDADDIIKTVESKWREWTDRFDGAGEWSEIALRSLITLKALTHHETGGIVAAATTSLPESIGGVRNWDYRFCWLRDATLTLDALIESNFIEEANDWRQWLLRAVAGSPEQLQIMYGIAGERRLDEWVISWLPGYEKSAPVRVGNAAMGQIQLDIYGEVLDAFYFARKHGLPSDAAAWDLERALIGHLEKIWDQPDDGVWEVRGDRQQFSHSKVMAWVAFDRVIRSAEEFGLEGPLDEWRAIRQTIHDEVCAKGYDAERGSFVQAYGSKNLDASLLMIPLVGFLPVSDPRVAGTVAAIERELLHDGFVLRYDTGSEIDGLPVGEGAFLACSFWLADNYVLMGRIDDARQLFEKLVALCNDVGLLAEEYDPRTKRQTGNFPQAFSHIALINTAYNLSRVSGPTAQRGAGARIGAPPEDRPREAVFRG